MRLLNAIIDGLQRKFPPARATLAIVALVTPVVAAASAVGTPWVATHFPGLPAFTSGQLTTFALGGIAAVLGAAVPLAYRYIDGWQKKEEADRTAAAATLAHKRAVELKLVDRGEHTATTQTLEDAAASTTGTTVVPTTPAVT